MTRQELIHHAEHANRGFGENPANCPVCPHLHEDLAARIKELEERPGTRTIWAQIAVGAATSVFAAFIIERMIRKTK